MGLLGGGGLFPVLGRGGVGRRRLLGLPGGQGLLGRAVLPGPPSLALGTGGPFQGRRRRRRGGGEGRVRVDRVGSAALRRWEEAIGR